MCETGLWRVVLARGGADSAGLWTPTTPPPPQGASGQQLVAKGTGLKSLWAPKAPAGNSIAFGKSTLQRIYPMQYTPKIGEKLPLYILSSTPLGGTLGGTTTRL